MIIIASDTSSIAALYLALYGAVIIFILPFCLLIKKWPSTGIVIGAINLLLGAYGLLNLIQNSWGGSSPVATVFWIVEPLPLLLGILYLAGC